MIRRNVSCSWCQASNSLDDPTCRNCSDCGHRFDLPRSECDCPKCKPTPEERERQKHLDRIGMAYVVAVVQGDVEAAGAIWGEAEENEELATRLHEIDMGLEHLNLKKGEAT